jgi:microcystin-dependent protein
MAAVTRRQYKGAAASTTITAGINSSATSCSLAANTGWPSSSGVPFYVVIDPGTSTEEKCSATIAGTTLTLTRGQDDTTAVAHSANAVIYPVFSADEADEANLFASTMTTRGDLLTMGSGPTVARLPIGSNSGYVLKTDGTDPSWGQVAAAGIASDAVTTVKILDSAVTSAKIADATIVQGDLALTLLKALCPVGTIAAYAGATAPTGWILCNGTAVSAGTYPELNAICATTPDLRGRFALGKTASGTGSTLLGTGGSTTIAEANLPSHTHSVTSNVTITNVNESAHTHANTLGGTTSFATTTHGHIQTHNYTSTYALGNGNYYTEGNTVSNQDVSTGPASAGATVTLTNVAGSAHQHANTLTNNAVTSGGGTGSGTDYNQPFLAVNYIIKHDYV